MTHPQRIFADRIFALPAEDSNQQAWYCLTREYVLGPYSTEALARAALIEFVAWCQSIGWSGERDTTQSLDAVSLDCQELPEAA